VTTIDPATVVDLAHDGPPDRKIAIVGLGYVGLPLALGFLDAGLAVTGLDADPVRVARLRDGASPVDDVSDERLAAALEHGIAVHGLDGAAISAADVVIVCVPTPINLSRDPDLGHVLSAARFVSADLRAGQLVILQSTTFPGTTSGPFRAALEEGSGLTAGRDFDLAFVPERVNPGDPASAGRAVPRVVGGLTPAATARTASLFRQVNSTVVEVSSPDAAEMAKLLENIFRNVNIALVNQLALLCERMGIDVWEVIDAAATKPFGFMRFTPGPGVGGHCIPVDPYYLSWRARQFGFVDRFVELAGDINMTMPRHVVDLVAEALNARGRALKGARVGVLGVAFKPNVRDARNSPAADVLAQLRQRGAVVSFHDPHVASFTDVDDVTMDGIELDTLLSTSDVVIALVAHRAIDWDAVFDRADLIVDTVDAARERKVRPEQVLLLGAGWVPSI
jgi:UDP-N-acetyl-D-glucosamine dehydrogenase